MKAMGDKYRMLSLSVSEMNLPGTGQRRAGLRLHTVLTRLLGERLWQSIIAVWPNHSEESIGNDCTSLKISISCHSKLAVNRIVILSCKGSPAVLHYQRRLLCRGECRPRLCLAMHFQLLDLLARWTTSHWPKHCCQRTSATAKVKAKLCKAIESSEVMNVWNSTPLKALTMQATIEGSDGLLHAAPRRAH